MIHNERQKEERASNERNLTKSLMFPDSFLHIRLDAMGTDLTDCPWWFKAGKKKKSRLPCRIIGATVGGHQYEHIGCLVSDFSKEVGSASHIHPEGQYLYNVFVQNSGARWMAKPS